MISYDYIMSATLQWSVAVYGPHILRPGKLNLLFFISARPYFRHPSLLPSNWRHVHFLLSRGTGSAHALSFSISLAGQPFHKRGRIWCHAYTWHVPVLMQHLWICYDSPKKLINMEIWHLIGQHACWGQPHQFKVMWSNLIGLHSRLQENNLHTGMSPDTSSLVYQYLVE